MLATLLYPAFQAVVIRWWSSGLRFRRHRSAFAAAHSHVYAAYARFVGLRGPVQYRDGHRRSHDLTDCGRVTGAGKTTAGEIIATLLLLAAMLVAALGFRPFIARPYCSRSGSWAWSLLSGLSTLEKVKATGRPSSAIGEGLADALNVGSY